MKNKWLLLIIIWQFIGISLGFILSYPMLSFHGFIYKLMFTLSIVNSVALICSPILLYIDLKLNEKIKHVWVYSGLIILVVIISYYLSNLLVSPFVNSVCNVHIKHDVDKNHIYVIIANLFISISIVSAYLILYFYFKLKSDWERKVFEIESMKRLQLETKLKLIQSKVNPHFLFNTLNTALGLVYRVPSKVEEIILNLSEIYRTLLNLPESQPITLEDEIKLVKKYLEIEKIRLEERLQYEINVEISLYSFLIPPLILQSLVENAVIHGISSKKEGGTIKIDAIQKNDKVEITIFDSGIGFRSEIKNNGFGLLSVKERINIFYKGNASFKIVGIENNGTKIEMVLPIEKV